MCRSKKRKIVLYLYALTLVLLLMWGANAWFLIQNSFIVDISIRLLFFIITLLYQYLYKIKLILTFKKKVAIFLFYVGAILAGQITRMESFISFSVMFYPMLVLLCDKKNVYKILKIVRFVFSIVLIPSIILHIVFTLIGFPLSFLFVVEGNSFYTFYNYIILLKNISADGESIRYTGFFLEPGYLATLCSFLLYVFKYDLKNKYNCVLFIALILSFSLAGYVATLFGWLFVLYSKGKNVIRLFYFFLLLYLLFLSFKGYNGGDNYINKYIYSRLEYDKDKGIKGNNRNSELADFYFYKMCEDGSILLGKGASGVKKTNGGGADSGDYTNQIRGAGFKVYCIVNGCISAVCYMLFYLLLAIDGKKYGRKYRLLFFVLIVMIFMQASYPSSSSWLVPYILGINGSNRVLHRLKKSNLKNEKYKYYLRKHS